MVQIIAAVRSKQPARIRRQKHLNRIQWMLSKEVVDDVVVEEEEVAVGRWMLSVGKSVGLPFDGCCC